MKIFIIFSLLSLTGCAHYMPAAVSSASLGPKEHPVAVTEGRSSAYYLFGFMGPLGDDSLKAAVDDARSQRKSNTMVNVFVDREVLYFPFIFLPIFKRVSTSVYGTLVRYDDPWVAENLIPELESEQKSIIKPVQPKEPATKPRAPQQPSTDSPGVL